jgi:CheY-like chemotaxis protein
MTAKPKILLVDDEQAITANLSPFLERSGFVVAVAADGEEGLAQVSGFSPEAHPQALGERHWRAWKLRCCASVA